MAKIGEPKPGDLYVSPQGNDEWSGRLSEPNAQGTDGPLATVQRARDIIRNLLRYGALDGPQTVWLRGGRYTLSEPLEFGPEDAAPVTYAAYPGETPILDGGRRIAGWRETTINGRPALMAHLPEVAEGRWYFRQLFVAGQRRPRTRLPKEGYYWMADVPGTRPDDGLFGATSDRFRCAPGDIQPWRNLADVDVVVPHYWITERMPIASFDAQSNLVISSRRSRFALNDDLRRTFSRYWVENVFEALEEPGQWYLDRQEGILYYLPLPGEDAQTLEAFAPRLEQLLRIVGDPEAGRLVRFLRFVGLTFEHTDWQLPHSEQVDGVEYASDPQAAVGVPGAIYLEGAEHCLFQGCTMQHLGGYAVEIGEGCSGIRVMRNHLWDLGGGGVKLGGSDADGALCRRTGNNVIADNHIHAGGRVFHSAVGILATHAFNNELVHNHIHDFYYSGISCGWVWGYAESVSKNNRIEKNHIHDLGHGLLSDMGGIYTLGVQPGTVVRGNLIHDIRKWNYGGWAIYLDEGSSHITVENNVCYDTNSHVFHQHYGRENVVRNNIWAFGEEGVAQHSLIYGRTRSDYLSGLEVGRKAFTFERNILITDGRPFFCGSRGAPLERRNFISDLNLFWDVSGAEFVAGNVTYDAQGRLQVARAYPLEGWRALGQDRHSLVADPRFADLAARDFALSPDSPALELGFQPIDLSDVGPRPEE